MLPYYPRVLNRVYAFVNGYFWLPCPLCGRHFGGHETSDIPLMTSLSDGKAVCRQCGEIAQSRNRTLLGLAR